MHLEGVVKDCSHCAHAEPVVFPGVPVMECRRYPPIVIVIADEANKMWPQVDGDDWCGEFQQKEDLDATS